MDHNSLPDKLGILLTGMDLTEDNEQISVFYNPDSVEKDKPPLTFCGTTTQKGG